MACLLNTRRSVFHRMNRQKPTWMLYRPAGNVYDFSCTFVNFKGKLSFQSSISHTPYLSPPRYNVREERLIKKAKKETVDEGMNKVLESIQRQATIVEEILYRNHLKQPSVSGDDPFKACNDLNDNDRINEILSRQLAVIQGHFSRRCKKRREVHRLNAEIQGCDLRERTLQQCLGVDRYRRANIALKAIDQLGVELTGDCCSGNACANGIRLTKGSIPDPVRQLFCRTTLREDMYFTPVSQLHLVAWDESLNKAERNLKKYKEWSKNFKTQLVNVPENIQNEAPEIVNFREKCSI